MTSGADSFVMMLSKRSPYCCRLKPSFLYLTAAVFSSVPWLPSSFFLSWLTLRYSTAASGFLCFVLFMASPQKVESFLRDPKLFLCPWPPSTPLGRRQEHLCHVTWEGLAVRVNQFQGGEYLPRRAPQLVDLAPTEVKEKTKSECGML